MTSVKTSAAVDTADSRPVEDPLQQELARQKQELAEAEARVLEQLRQLDLLQALSISGFGDIGDFATYGRIHVNTITRWLMLPFAS